MALNPNPQPLMKASILVMILASSAAYAASEEHFSKTFPGATGGTLIVDIDFGAIEVDTNAKPSEISVDVWRKVTRQTPQEEQGFLRDNPVQFSTEGSTLKIVSRSNEKDLFKGKNRNDAKYTIRVPAQFNTRLDTSGGEISVNNLSGDTRANTSGGRLRFSGLHGPLNGHTSGGDVLVADCEGTTKIHTSGGRIEAAGGSGSLDANTSGGDVSLRTFNGPASVETSGGAITLAKVGGKLNASTSGGAAECNRHSSERTTVATYPHHRALVGR